MKISIPSILGGLLLLIISGVVLLSLAQPGLNDAQQTGSLIASGVLGWLGYALIAWAFPGDNRLIGHEAQRDPEHNDESI